MVTYTEGSEVSVDDSVEWSALSPTPGWVVEVHVGSTSHTTLSDSWAAFYIMKVETEEDGSFLLTVKFLGAEDEEVSQGLSNKFHRGGRLHLCLSRPCVEVRPLDALHVTRVRFWQWETFKGSSLYILEGIGRSINRWKKEIEEKAAPAVPLMAAAPKKTPKVKEGAGVKPGKGASVVGSGISPEMKDRLRSRLGDIKRRVRGTGGEVEPPVEAEPPPAEVVDTEEERELDGLDYVPTSPEEEPKIRTGTALVPLGGVLEKSGHPKLKEKGRAVATSDSGMKSLSGQLIQRAMQASKRRRLETKKKKKKKGSSSHQVAKLLSQILMGKSGKAMDKKKGTKKKRKLKDGVIRSSSTSSDEEVDSEESQSGETEEDLEAPMKKKSRDKPGSVLAMLTEHIRSVMEQSATADIPEEQLGVTGGIKVASYFQMHVKGQYPQYQRELREMHSLAATLDLLRVGDVARVGDSLSARFMALHQSMIDQGWGTARHMELHNMDETSAASAGMILASRKHSRLVDKVQGKGWNYVPWGGRGKGRGKHDWKGSQEETKGEKGKGKKGRKGKWQAPANWEKKVNEWEKSKEKGDDK